MVMQVPEDGDVTNSYTKYRLCLIAFNDAVDQSEST
jgi:hypothetical protein